MASGAHPDPDQHVIGRHAPAVVQRDGLDRPLAVDLRDRVAEDQLYALAGVQIGEPAGDVLAQQREQRQALELDDGDIDPRAPRRCRDLEADEPGADDEQALAATRAGARAACSRVLS